MEKSEKRESTLTASLGPDIIPMEEEEDEDIIIIVVDQSEPTDNDPFGTSSP